MRLRSSATPSEAPTVTLTSRRPTMSTISSTKMRRPGPNGSISGHLYSPTPMWRCEGCSGGSHRKMSSESVLMPSTPRLFPMMSKICLVWTTPQQACMANCQTTSGMANGGINNPATSGVLRPQTGRLTTLESSNYRSARPLPSPQTSGQSDEKTRAHWFHIHWFLQPSRLSAPSNETQYTWPSYRHCRQHNQTCPEGPSQPCTWSKSGCGASRNPPSSRSYVTIPQQNHSSRPYRGPRPKTSGSALQMTWVDRSRLPWFGTIKPTTPSSPPRYALTRMTASPTHTGSRVSLWLYQGVARRWTPTRARSSKCRYR